MYNEYQIQANDLVANFGEGTMPGVIYDTAIVGSLKDNVGTPLFPYQVEYVLKRQHEDGSWGAANPLPYDRLMSTAAVLYMMVELNIHKKPFFEPFFEKGVGWLEENYQTAMKSQYPRTVGFEFIYPHLISTVLNGSSSLSEKVRFSKLDKLVEQKLEIFGEGIYRVHTPLVFSAEGIVRDVSHAEMISSLLSENGSLGASPSATTVLLKYPITNSRAKRRAFQYIQNSILPDQSVVHFKDYTYMNIVYSLYPLFKAGFQIGSGTVFLSNRILNGWSEYGLSFGKAFKVPDADDTSVALVDLHYMGVPNLERYAEALKFYEADDHYKTYPGELGQSMLNNLHVLDYLLTTGTEENVEKAGKVLRFIENNLRDNPHQLGKYHSSLAYQMGSMLLSMFPQLSNYAQPYVIKLEVMLKDFVESPETNYLADEELAAAIFGLLHAHHHGIDVNCDLVRRAFEILRVRTHGGTRPDYTPLWMSKVAYSPIHMIRANVLSGLMYYERMKDVCF